MSSINNAASIATIFFPCVLYFSTFFSIFSFIFGWVKLFKAISFSSSLNTIFPSAFLFKLPSSFFIVSPKVENTLFNKSKSSKICLATISASTISMPWFINIVDTLLFPHPIFPVSPNTNIFSPTLFRTKNPLYLNPRLI